MEPGKGEKNSSPLLNRRLEGITARIDATEIDPLAKESFQLFLELRRLTTPTDENLARFRTANEDVTLITEFDALQLPDSVLGKLRTALTSALELLVKTKGKGRHPDDEAHVVIEVIRNLSRSDVHKDKLTKLPRLIQLLLEIVADPSFPSSFKLLVLGVLNNVATSPTAIMDILPLANFFETLVQFIQSGQGSSENKEWAVAVLSNVSNTAPTAAGMLYNVPLFVDTIISVANTGETAACREWGLQALCGLCNGYNQQNMVRLYKRQGFPDLVLRYIRNPRLEDTEEGQVYAQLRETAIGLVAALTLPASVHRRLVHDRRLVDELFRVLSTEESPRIRVRTLEVFHYLAEPEPTKALLYTHRPLLFWLIDKVRTNRGCSTLTAGDQVDESHVLAMGVLEDLQCPTTRLNFFELFVTLASVRNVPRLSRQCQFKMISIDLIRMAAWTLLW